MSDQTDRHLAQGSGIVALTRNRHLVGAGVLTTAGVGDGVMRILRQCRSIGILYGYSRILNLAVVGVRSLGQGHLAGGHVSGVDLISQGLGAGIVAFELHGWLFQPSGQGPEHP